MTVSSDVQVDGRRLATLADQSLGRDRFEVVVVLAGKDHGTADMVRSFGQDHPDLRVRQVQFSEPQPGRGFALGVAAARGDYVTVLPDELVRPNHLEAMLEHAAEDVAVVARSGDGEHPGRTAAAAELSSTLSGLGGVLVWAPAARAGLGAVDGKLDDDEGLALAYWLTAFGGHHFQVHVLAKPTVSAEPVVSAVEPPSYGTLVMRPLRRLLALESVACPDGETIRLRRALSEAQARSINDYLRGHPDEHARMVADAFAHGLREVPWSRVNEGLARDLAVCYCFPPYLDTSAIVAAKRLREWGRVTDVVSHDLATLRPRDPGAIRLAESAIGRTHEVAGTATFSEWSAMPDFAEKTWTTVVEWERGQAPYRTLYSRAMAIGSHFAAALIKLRRPEIEWVAEFSDPLRFNPLGEERVGGVAADWLSEELAAGMTAAGHPVSVDRELRIFDFAERLVYALADRVIFTNPAQRELMLGYCSDPSLVERVRPITDVQSQPTPPRHVYELVETPLVREPGVVHLAYFGAFYSTRDLGDVVRALGRLRQHERERLRFHVYTGNPRKLALEVVREGLAGVVIAQHLVPVLEFLNLSTRYDVLVVNDYETIRHHGVNPYLPAKVADYAGSGTPVWAVCEPGSVMSGMSFDHRTVVGDVDGAVGVLRTLLASSQLAI